ncbi:hypothetical protein HB804_08440 [Listeria welshimeri]|nr:hypothetical protein [Listeria welshimeri]MBC1449514.1 hypothetical protein [Listeria welshimeri]MBC2015847.1 hypothetical protein [Listeria welshimeri]MBC2349259.1 hypothetical protein [Listeria welshimeri]MBF2388495.1 hypothetical protein [Listeria welshimeri]
MVKKRFINIILLTMLVVILSGCGGAEQTSDKEPEIPKTNQNDIELSVPPILKDSKGEVLKSEKDALEDVQNFINKQNTTKQGEVGLSIVEFVELVESDAPTKYAFMAALVNRSDQEGSDIEMKFTITNKATKVKIYDGDTITLPEEQFGFLKPNHAIPFKITIPDTENITSKMTVQDYDFKWEITNSKMKE